MSDMQIDLAGLEDKWSTSGAQICAVCGRDFDHLPEEEYEKDDGNTVPLLLWRNDGTEMMTFCWECAKPRMKSNKLQSKDDLVALACEESKKLDKAGFQIPVVLDATCAQVLISAIQVAMRHPDWRKQDRAAGIVDEIVQGIIDRIPPECVSIRKIIQQGFDQHFDA